MIPEQELANAIYWTTSTVAQSVVALLAFGAFLAGWRLDRQRQRRSGPTVAVNFAAIVEHMLESPSSSLGTSVREWLTRNLAAPPEFTGTGRYGASTAEDEMNARELLQHSALVLEALQGTERSDFEADIGSLEKWLQRFDRWNKRSARVFRALKWFSWLGLACFVGSVLALALTLDIVACWSTWQYYLLATYFALVLSAIAGACHVAVLVFGEDN